MKAKYNALRGISLIYKALAVVVLAGTIFAIIACFLRIGEEQHSFTLFGSRSQYRYDTGDAIVDSILILMGGGFLALALAATAEIFQLFMSVEENTRVSRMALMRLVKQLPSANPVSNPPNCLC